MKSYQQVTITVRAGEEREILVALLSEAGYEGFVEEPGRLLAYIPFPEFNAAALDTIIAPFAFPYTLEEIQQKNWNAEWESGFQPVTIAGFCAIRADFHDPVPGVQHDIIITPKMSFGTGHHGTTYLMAASMQDIDFAGREVLDFGTGTGILAVLAEKLDAARILAIDNDEWSINNAAENFVRNQCSHINLQLAETIPGAEKFDIILANINKHVILDQLPSMVAHASPGSIILISGLLQSDAADLSKAIALLPLTLSKQTERQSWLCWQLIVKAVV